MAYMNDDEMKNMGFRSLGNNVKISAKASIYNCDQIEIGDNSRIDDYCIISGKIQIGRHVHVTPMCLIAGGKKGIIIGDFVTMAYGVKVFTQSDDYSGETMANSTVPKKYKNEYKNCIAIKKHTIIGAGSIIMPGVTLAEGVSIGAMTLVLKNTEPWSIYVGVPAKKIKNRSKNLLNLEAYFLKNNDSI
ncbi:dTDP-4-amino-4,6-dideoxygalactose transaminase [hydrothermal vent metagenome]|uniref:Chloramphenicol acetyltransferase n=1 Tax=hydrothermal vent metagenome TaxID=652676 RepID=A0A3B0XCU8_9ZZZZ